MFLCCGASTGIELRRVSYDPEFSISDPLWKVEGYLNFSFSADLKFLAIFTLSTNSTIDFPDKKLFIYDFESNSGAIQLKSELTIPNLNSFSFSPSSQYFYLLFRKIHSEDNFPLVRIYKLEDMSDISLSFQITTNPTCFFTENFFAITTPNGINFHNIHDNTTTEFNTPVKAVDYASETIAIVTTSRELHLLSAKDFTKITGRTILCGVDFLLKMNPKGNSVLCLASKPASNSSYLGETLIFYLNTDGKIKLTQNKAGTCHGCSYSPNGDAFIFIAGAIPPVTQLVNERNGRNVAICDQPMNTIAFSCNTGLISLGGFGAFNGNILTYDYINSIKLAEDRMQTTSEMKWSPCGRLLLFSVLWGKMKVGNEIRITDHYLQILSHIKYQELVQADWVGQVNALPLPKKKPPQKQESPSAYVPPHLRSQTKNVCFGYNPKSNK